LRVSVSLVPDYTVDFFILFYFCFGSRVYKPVANIPLDKFSEEKYTFKSIKPRIAAVTLKSCIPSMVRPLVRIWGFESESNGYSVRPWHSTSKPTFPATNTQFANGSYQSTRPCE